MEGCYSCNLVMYRIIGGDVAVVISVIMNSMSGGHVAVVISVIIYGTSGDLESDIQRFGRTLPQMTFLPCVFTLTALKMAMTISHQRSIVKFKKNSIEVPI